MNPFSLVDQVQLVLLRRLSAVLALVDGMLSVDWGERLLDRLAQRWQGQIAKVDAALAQLEVERHHLHLQAEAMAIQTAAIHLGARMLARKELLFDPADPQDERILDASIELLVKDKLAAIETGETATGQYVYHLEPEWAAIRSRLVDATDRATPELAAWLQEGIQFIDESFLHET
jgi:hypothetical protein